MAQFDLTSEWRVRATIDEVSDILSQAERLPDWWGAVYLSVDILSPGGADGIGRRIDVHARGRLPYTIRWQGEVIAADPPHGWVLKATGDLVGQGAWTLWQDGDTAVARYRWQVDVAKPWMRALAPLLRPLFAWNHAWAMAKGEEGLRRELERRRVSAGP